MSQAEQDRLIASAVLERTGAKQKLKLITDRLRNIGRDLVRIGHALDPQGNGRPASDAFASSLPLLREEILEVLNREKVQALIAERNELEATIERCTSALTGYGAE